ncbi:MAG: AsnC family protein, partial [Gammaproteobacteria bacterium]|nr:AsnC family protein [Gammaproteobacteria bacterium]
MTELDDFDRAILEVLQREGKISAQELAQKTHLSA